MGKQSRSTGPFDPERILRQLVEEIPAIFWATDRELRLRAAFGGGWTMLGLCPGNVLGKSLPELFAASDADPCLVAAHRRALDGETVHLDWKWAGRGFHIRVIPLLEQSGEIYGCAVEGRDITEQQQIEQALKRSRDDLESRIRQRTADLAAANTRLRAEVNERRNVERALRLSEQRFRLAFEEGPVGMAFVSLDGVVLLANRALSDMLAYTPAELEGHSYAKLTHPDDVAVDGSLIQQTLRGEIPGYVLEKRYLTRTGKVVWGRRTATVIRDQEGQPLYTFSIVESIKRPYQR